MQLTLYSDDAMLKHDPRGPERPDRLRAIHGALEVAHSGVTLHTGDTFERQAVERVHDSSYVDDILELEGESAWIDADTTTSPGSVGAMRAAVGCSLAAVRDAMKERPAWALVRPPGHHAGPANAAGFCFFGNIAIAAEEARRLGAERILIVDWDVHHGNGTQEMFWSRGDVFYFSTHQWPLYPGTGAEDETGEGEGEGATRNVPMPAGCDDEDYLEVFETVLRPAAAEFDPELVLVSAGFDAHARDPLAGMNVTTRGFARMAGVVADIVKEHCPGRLALFLEGGYDLGGLADSVVATLDALQEEG